MGAAPDGRSRHSSGGWCESGFVDRTPDKLPSPAARLLGNPQATGHDGGRDLNFRVLHEMGVELLGRYIGAEGSRLQFADDLAASVDFGDARLADLLKFVEAVLRRQRNRHTNVRDAAAAADQDPHRARRRARRNRNRDLDQRLPAGLRLGEVPGLRRHGFPGAGGRSDRTCRACTSWACTGCARTSRRSCTAWARTPRSLPGTSSRVALVKIAVAMSGGVDSSVAAALLQAQGHDVVGVTLQQWPRGETEESAQARRVLLAVRGGGRAARRLAARHSLLLLEPREGVRRAGHRAVPSRLPRGPHAQSVRALQRIRALRPHARARARARIRPTRDRALRANRQRACRARAAHRGGRGEGPVLHALSPRPRAPGAHRVSARWHDQARGARARARVRASGRRQGREPGDLLRAARRDRALPLRSGCRCAPAPSSTRAGGSSAPIAARRSTRSASAAVSATCREAGPWYVLRVDARGEPTRGRPQGGAWRRARWSSET